MRTNVVSKSFFFFFFVDNQSISHLLRANEKLIHGVFRLRKNVLFFRNCNLDRASLFAASPKSPLPIVQRVRPGCSPSSMGYTPVVDGLNALIAILVHHDDHQACHILLVILFFLLIPISIEIRKRVT